MVSGNATHQIAVLGAIGGGALTTDALAVTLPIGRPAVVAACGRLVTRGLIERLEEGVFRLSASGQALLRDGGTLSSGAPARGKRLRPVYVNSLRQRAWRAMRMSLRFSVADIEQLAAAGDDRDPGENIRRFACALASAGYLAELPCKKPGMASGSTGFKLWRMIRDTGDHAPQFVRAKNAFYDRNTREVFPCV